MRVSRRFLFLVVAVSLLSCDVVCGARRRKRDGSGSFPGATPGKKSPQASTDKGKKEKSESMPPWMGQAPPEQTAQQLDLSKFMSRLGADELQRMSLMDADEVALRVAAVQGHVESAFLLGQRLRTGTGTEKDLARSLEFLLDAAQANHSLAQLAVAEILGSEPYVNETGSVEWMQKAADNEVPQALFVMGTRFQNGFGVPRNFTTAVHYFRKAAKAGHVPAKFALGDAYYFGYHTKREPKKAFKFYQEAADAGLPDAQAAVARCYGMGEGVEKSESLQREWLEKAVAGGATEAQVMLGNLMYVEGHEPAKAAEFFRAAAHKGDPNGQFMIGWLYEIGYGVEHDIDQAKAWYSQASESGYPVEDQRLAFHNNVD